MTQVLDASAVLAFLQKKPGYEKVKDALAGAASGGRELLMSTVNWGEVYYLLLKHYGPEGTAKIEAVLDSFPIELVPPGRDAAKQAALYKATQKLPYADSFAAALAKIHRAELLTADREFEAVKPEIKIVWL